MNVREISISLPAWLREHLDARDRHDKYKQHDQQRRESQMKFVIELARKNIEEKSGGPFAAAVFNMNTGELIAAGVNLVTSCGLSIAHAEIIAIMFAQKKFRTFDLGGADMPKCELVSSVEPCAMCMGAIPWSGVRSLVCGARDEDARAAGFDEGSKRDDWVSELEARNINVIRDILREEAADVLKNYAINGGMIYNSRTQKKHDDKENR